MTAQVLFSNVFSKKDLQLSAVEKFETFIGAKSFRELKLTNY